MIKEIVMALWMGLGVSSQPIWTTPNDLEKGKVPEVTREEADEKAKGYLDLHEEFNKLYSEVWRLKGKRSFSDWEKSNDYWTEASPLLRQLHVLVKKIEKVEDSTDFRAAMWFYDKPFEECELFLVNHVYRRRFNDEFFRRFIEPNPMTYKDVLEDMMARAK